MQRLNAMQGLEPVREAVQRLMQSIEYDLTEAEHGRGAETVALHPGNMLLVGSPGTGKSTVAGIIADLLFGMGCIERQRYHRVARGELIGRFQGYTTANVQAALEQARDGVLFIDEAHQLHKGEWDSYGDEIISELNEKITHPDYSGTVFILGGYEEAIDALLQRVDPGMTRRFPRRIRFPSFTPQACARLAQTHLEEENYQWEDGLMSQIARRAEEETQRKGRHFGNAGWVEEFVKEALAGMKSRIVQSRMPAGHVDRRRLMVCDLPDGLAEDTLEEID